MSAGVYRLVLTDYKDVKISIKLGIEQQRELYSAQPQEKVKQPRVSNFSGEDRNVEKL